MRVLWRRSLAALRSVLRRPAKTSPPRPAPRTSAAGSPNSPNVASGPAADSLTLTYAPFDDDKADPGEIVWAWVPYEEDPTQGKDRPVLVIGRQRGTLLALMLTSKDHDRDSADEARHGRHWVDIGSGGWDPRRRPSEVRVDRLLRIDPTSVRRQGAVLDERRYNRVVDGVRAATARC